MKPSKVMLSCVLYVMLAYFIYHVLSGERGLLSYMHLSQELEEKKAIIKSLKEEKEALEKKIALVGGDDIDADTLDELARKNLGLINENEEVWIIENE